MTQLCTQLAFLRDWENWSARGKCCATSEGAVQWTRELVRSVTGNFFCVRGCGDGNVVIGEWANGLISSVFLLRRGLGIRAC